MGGSWQDCCLNYFVVLFGCRCTYFASSFFEPFQKYEDGVKAPQVIPWRPSSLFINTFSFVLFCITLHWRALGNLLLPQITFTCVYDSLYWKMSSVYMWTRRMEWGSVTNILTTCSSRLWQPNQHGPVDNSYHSLSQVLCLAFYVNSCEGGSKIQCSGRWTYVSEKWAVSSKMIDFSEKTNQQISFIIYKIWHLKTLQKSKKENSHYVILT